MKKNIGLLIVVLLVVAMIGTYVKQQINEDRAIEKSALGKDIGEREIGLGNGDTPPDFTLTSLDGESSWKEGCIEFLGDMVSTM